MPIDPLYSDSPLLRGVNNSGCPKTSTDVSYTSLRGEPVVTEISDRKMCVTDMFKTDQFLANTDGCCVLESSELNCTDIANVDAAEENNYYMGLRYFDVDDESKGERKICYTTPIRKKKLHIMDLLTKVLMDIIIFIIMVLVAACYEYWIIYGGCETKGIRTTLFDAPYKVGNHSPSNQPSSKPSNLNTQDCPGNTVNKSSGTGLEWYDTFPYNLISFLNTNKGYNGSVTDTSNNFDLLELAKIPARSLLLGFFYCIIFSRIAMLTLIRWINKVGFSYIYNKEPSKIGKFLSGLIFIVFFMGIYGALTDRYIVKLPYLNASSLFLLALIIIITIWIPSLLSFFIMMLSFMGYRRGSYDKYKAEREKENDTNEDSGETNEKEKAEFDGVEYFYQKFDYYLLIEYLFRMKQNLTDKEDNVELCKKDSTSNFEINNEEDLDWFFPIRRSKLAISMRSKRMNGIFWKLLDFDFTRCKEGEDEKHYIGFGKKYYWYLSQFYKFPWKLVDPFFTLKVNCDEIKASNEKHGWWWLLFMLVMPFFYTQIRFYTWLASIVITIAILILLPIMIILFTSIVMIIVMYSIFIALFGNILALFYLHFYVIVGFFYVPITHYQELLKIIKSHGNILTLLFCIIVVLAGVNVLHPTSIGVIGGILGLLILYKLITLLNV